MRFFRNFNQIINFLTAQIHFCAVKKYFCVEIFDIFMHRERFCMENFRICMENFDF